MNRAGDLFLTALAPTIWGSTYIVTTEFLPDGFPLTAALFRALPAGLLLLLFARKLPSGQWWWKVLVLGALNFSIFFWLLFEAAYRLPGGVAATLGAIQPLIVLFVSSIVLGSSIGVIAVGAALAGIVGVALLVINPDAMFDTIGIVAGLGGAASMALGIVLTRRWQPPVPLLTFTAWQLCAGGILLVPVVMAFEPGLPPLSLRNLAGYSYLCLIGGVVTYSLWFRGIARLDPNTVSPLGFLSPASAVVLGWLFLGQKLDALQLMGFVIVLCSIWVASRISIASPNNT